MADERVRERERDAILAPHCKHGVDLPDEVPELVHYLFELLVLLSELLQMRKEKCIR